MNNHEFLRGVEIYREQGGSAVLLEMFERYGATPFNVKKLGKELGVVGTSETLAPVGVLGTSETLAPVGASGLGSRIPPLSRTGKPGMTGEDSVELDFKKRMKPLFDEASFLHSKKLSEDVPIEERREAAFRILTIHEDELPLIYKERDYYRKHGHLPKVNTEAKEAYETDPFKMVKRQGNLRTYISKYKNKADRADDVMAWRDELGYYEKVMSSET